ncbi:glycoside hydrolase family 25 protein [Variovorax sp. OV329]|uniref:glycoside hydrolase family 25 protein n=1 Tax=Variovorax sp. OV329 TaxID=1882825 RepID=UPI0008E7FE67|nr:glycoside hydrolase family 25 protein [Variovorax sp. OV329]SFM56783.1 Lyzozyme M1 (1,4-beta-N-acetylmuramidase), GH25 family [Variovorax sp. OV329]
MKVLDLPVSGRWGFLATSFAVPEGAAAATGEFDRPWLHPDAALLLDPFADNTINWEKLKAETRVVAIIHKSTIGTTRIDSGYFARKAEARARGYLWGSYHWGVSGEPRKQADHYIDTVKPEADELIALDLEDANSKELMNADEALVFVRRIKERTGRHPVLYTNHASAKLISAEFANSDFAKTPLWYARFRASVSDFPAGVWPSYTLWQFSSEILPQLPIAGTRPDMDVNVYNGTVAQLKANWPLTRAGD